METAVLDIEEDRWISVDGNPRQQHVDRDQHIPEQPTQARPATPNIRVLENVVGPVRVDRRDGIEVGPLLDGVGHE